MVLGQAMYERSIHQSLGHGSLWPPGPLDLYLRAPAATMLFLASPSEVRLELWLRPIAISSAPALPICVFAMIMSSCVDGSGVSQ